MRQSLPETTANPGPIPHAPSASPKPSRASAIVRWVVTTSRSPTFVVATSTVTAVGKRGPAPKPSALKKLQGTFRADRAARNEVTAPVGAPPKPEKLDQVASSKWDELTGLLIERGTLSREDGVALEQFCRFYSQWLKYQRIAELKPVVKTMYGPKVNPATETALKLEQRLTALGDRLGLTASARSKVSAPEKPQEVDKTADFLFGRPQVINGGKA